MDGQTFDFLFFSQQSIAGPSSAGSGFLKMFPQN